MTVRDATYTFATLPIDSPAIPTVEALIKEDEGVSAVLTLEQAKQYGITGEDTFAWRTLTIHSPLEAVGLTATFSSALTQTRLSCNVPAGFYHDHLPVPFADRDRALEVLRSIRSEG